MPVHAVVEKGRVVGWQWGRSKIWRTKEQAERQARAILASGYRGDARTRAGRAQIRRALEPSLVAERQYTADLLAIVRGVQKGIRDLLDRDVLPDATPRADADTPAERGKRVLSPRLRKKVAKHVEDRVGPSFELMAKSVDKKNRRAMALLGIPLEQAAEDVADELEAAKRANIDLVVNETDDWLDQLQGVLNESAGLRVEEIAKRIAKRCDVSQSRAKFIAVDQTLKLGASLTRLRQQAAGVDSYTWSTSRDERVRPMHAALEGQKFRYDDPPVTAEDGAKNNPGMDYRCRCIGLPLIKEFEQAEDEPEDLAAE